MVQAGGTRLVSALTAIRATSTRVRWPAPTLWLGGSVVLAVIWTAAAPLDPDGGRMRAILAVAVVALPALAFQRSRVQGKLVLDPLLALACCFFAWHLGFWAMWALGLDYRWRASQYVIYDLGSVMAGVLACALALYALIGGLQLGARRVAWPRRETRELPRGLYAIAAAGLACLLVYTAVRGGDVIGHYEYVFTSDDALRRLFNLGNVLVLGTVGPVALLERSRRRCLLYLGAIALPAAALDALLGSRWVLFSMVVVVATALSLRGVGRRLWWFALVAVALVVVSAMVRDARLGRDPIRALQYENPVIGFPQDAGQASIPMIGEVQSRSRGADWRYGESLGGAVASVVPSFPQLVGLDADRPSIELARKYYRKRFERDGYTPGYSMAAELYRNFGIVGIVAGMAAFGFLIGFLYRRAALQPGYAATFLFFAVFAISIFGIRNDLTTWLRFAVWGAAIFWFVGRRIDRAAERAPA